MSAEGGRDDLDVRQRYADLRGGEQSLAPPFASLVGSRARRSGTRPSLAAWTGIGLAAAMAALAGTRAVRAHLESRDAAAIARALGPLGEVRWRSPTDVLLATPGREFLVAIPPIGVGDAPAQPSQSPRDSGD